MTSGLDAVRDAASFDVAAPARARRPGAPGGRADRRGRHADGGRGLRHGPGRLVVVQRPHGEGSTLPPILPAVSIAGSTGRELATALGTAIAFTHDGVDYVLAGSLPAVAAETAARDLVAGCSERRGAAVRRHPMTRCPPGNGRVWDGWRWCGAPSDDPITAVHTLPRGHIPRPRLVEGAGRGVRRPGRGAGRPRQERAGRRARRLPRDPGARSRRARADRRRPPARRGSPPRRAARRGSRT